MKRFTCLLFLMLVICIASSAQITNKILGLTLGVSTRTQVLQAISDNKLHIRERGTDIIACTSNSFEFGGYSWSFITFNFYKGKLYAIAFLTDRYPTCRENFSGLTIALKEKYEKYLTRNDSYGNGDRWVEYDDGKTTVSLSFDFRNNRYNGGLLYCDKRLMDMKSQKDKSEL